ncbi:MAG: Asp/Glu racemase [Chloroflexota bacterium]|nr:MAG: Asp/Glu racemase [Chloroflexota bacterium]
MKLAIIHTTPATLVPLKELAAEILPGCDVINFVDDSILPQLAETGGDLTRVEERLVGYARFAQQAGAEVILSACSSVGEIVPAMRQAVSIPVIRIDEAMAEKAVRSGATIGVAATLATTLNPTLRLLRQKAEEAGLKVEFKPVLVSAAYQKLMAGDKDGHDDLLVEALEALTGEVDGVVLAQASMARVLPRLPETERGKFFTSPRTAMEQVRKASQA